MKAKLASCTCDKHFSVFMVKSSKGVNQLAKPEMLSERMEFSKTNHKVVELLPSFLSSQSKIVQEYHQNRQNTEGMEEEVSHKTLETCMR